MRIQPLHSESPLFFVLMLGFWGLLIGGVVQNRFKDVRIGCVAFIALLLPRMFSSLSGGGSIYYFGFWNTYPCLIALAPLFHRFCVQLKRPGLLVIAVLIAASTASNLSVAKYFSSYFAFAPWQYQQMPENVALAKNILFQSHKQKQYDFGIEFFESIEKNPRFFYLKPFHPIMFERDHLCVIYNYAGLIYGYAGQFENARAPFEKQIALDHCLANDRLDAFYRLYLIAEKLNHTSARSLWKEKFLVYLHDPKNGVDPNLWQDALTQMAKKL